MYLDPQKVENFLEQLMVVSTYEDKLVSYSKLAIGQIAH